MVVICCAGSFAACIYLVIAQRTHSAGDEDAVKYYHFSAHQFRRIDQFKNAATQNLTREQFLPVEPVEKEGVAEEEAKADYIFQPNKEEIVYDLIPKSLKVQFYKTLLDSYASEHGARMTAMHQATDNAQEILKDLNLAYNKARQAAITNEILEIVGGAEALKG